MSRSFSSTFWSLERTDQRRKRLKRPWLSPFLLDDVEDDDESAREATQLGLGKTALDLGTGPGRGWTILVRGILKRYAWAV
jgi:hypothetical protein